MWGEAEDYILWVPTWLRGILGTKREVRIGIYNGIKIYLSEIGFVIRNCASVNFHGALAAQPGRVNLAYSYPLPSANARMNYNPDSNILLYRTFQHRFALHLYTHFSSLLLLHDVERKVSRDLLRMTSFGLRHCLWTLL